MWSPAADRGADSGSNLPLPSWLIDNPAVQQILFKRNPQYLDDLTPEELGLMRVAEGVWATIVRDNTLHLISSLNIKLSDIAGIIVQLNQDVERAHTTLKSIHTQERVDKTRKSLGRQKQLIGLDSLKEAFGGSREHDPNQLLKNVSSELAIAYQMFIQFGLSVGVISQTDVENLRGNYRAVALSRLEQRPTNGLRLLVLSEAAIVVTSLLWQIKNSRL